MRRSLFLCLLLVTLPALARADFVRPAPPQTRQEEIDQLQARIDKLKAMPDDEWAQRHKHNQDRKALMKHIKQQQKNGGPGVLAPTPDPLAPSVDPTQPTEAAPEAAPTAPPEAAPPAAPVQ